MKKILLVITCCFCLCGCTVTMSEEQAEESQDFMEWLGFKRCETKDCK